MKKIIVTSVSLVALSAVSLFGMIILKDNPEKQNKSKEIKVSKFVTSELVIKDNYNLNSILNDESKVQKISTDKLPFHKKLVYEDSYENYPDTKKIKVTKAGAIEPKLEDDYENYYIDGNNSVFVATKDLTDMYDLSNSNPSHFY